MKTKPIIAIIALLAVAGIAYLFTSPRNTVEAPADNDGPDAPALKSFSNDEYGISFQYPADYVVEERDLDTANRRHHAITIMKESDWNELKRAIEDGVPREAPPSVSVDIFQNDLDKQSITSWVEGSSNSNYKLATGAYASTTVAGTEALAYGFTGLYEGDALVFAHKGNIVMLSATYMGPEESTRTVMKQVIVPSLRLTSRQ